MRWKDGKIPDHVLKGRKLLKEKNIEWHENVFIRNVQEQLILHNQNLLVCFVGKPGYGKSWSAASFAREVDPGFWTDRIVFADPLDFMKMAGEEFPSGSAIMWDEIGVGLDNRDFFSILNKAVTHIAQTFRDQNHLVLFTVPEASFADKKLRDLFHAIVWMTGHKSHEEGWALGKWLWRKNTPFAKEAYHVYPRMGISRISGMKFYKLPTAIANSYERMNKEFKQKLRQQKIAEVTALLAPREKEEAIAKQPWEQNMNARQITNYVKDNKDTFISKEGYYDLMKIQYEFGIGKQKAQQVISFLNMND